jgi:hypothetical protein
VRWLGVALIVAMLAPAAETRAEAATPAGSGCAPDRLAIAHHPGGAALAPQPADAPIPCGVLTGFGGKEVRIVVSGSGAVFFSPAVKDPGPTSCAVRCASAGLAITSDGGTTWSYAESPTGSRVDNGLYADPDSNRVFWLPFATATPTLAVRFSDDDGATWHDTTACCGSAENPRVVTAKPRSSTPSGYSKVVYLCSNTSYLGGLEPLAGARVCSKSLDGGATFSLIGPLFSKPVPQHAECLPRGEVFAAVDNHYPQAAPDGSLYVLVRCGGNAPSDDDTEYLARSTDEGANWPIVHEVPLPDESAGDMDQLRVDTAGNLYLFHTDATTYHPMMQISTDGGANWSDAIDLAAPGVEVGRPAQEAEEAFASPQLWEVAVREPGHVAVAYYARPDGQERWDAYLGETRNALAPRPLLWSARLNPDDVDLTDAVTDTIGNDFLGAAIAPDGTPWGGYYHATGFAGRLVRGAAVPTPARPPVLPATGGTPWALAGAGAALAAVYCVNRSQARGRSRQRAR